MVCLILISGSVRQGLVSHKKVAVVWGVVSTLVTRYLSIRLVALGIQVTTEQNDSGELRRKKK